MEGYPLPLHGKGAKLFRPSQIVNVLTNIHETDTVQWTPLHSAAVQGNTPTVLKLLQLNAVLDAVTDTGQTPLHLAVYAGSRETVKLLLAWNANTRIATKNEKNTCLHMACEGGWREISTDLIAANADVNATNILERTPLHLAAFAGRADLGAILLRAGANPEAKDVHGWNARQMAELKGHRKFQELLVRATLTEKMPVIRELPPAEWHCQLWDEVIATTQKRVMEDRKEKEKWEKCVEEVAVARRKALGLKAEMAELERVARLEERRKEAARREHEREEARAAMLKDIHILGDVTLGPAKSTNNSKSGRPMPPLSLMGIKDESELRRTPASQMVVRAAGKK